jgi:predicted phosphoribosyltransferase
MQKEVTIMRFHDRTEAGRELAASLLAYANRPDLVVLALSRGAVPMAFEVARALDSPLDIFLVGQLGVPGHEELTMGAIGTEGMGVRNEEVVKEQHVSEDVLEAVAEKERLELEQREHLYRGNRPPVHVRGHTVILVDDGLTPAANLRAAVAVLDQQRPIRITVAIPVAAPETCAELKSEAYDVVCARTPEPSRPVGTWYDDFAEPTDAEVHDWLERAAVEYAST